MQDKLQANIRHLEAEERASTAATANTATYDPEIPSEEHPNGYPTSYPSDVPIKDPSSFLPPFPPEKI